MNRTAMQNFTPGAPMLENLGLPLASNRLRGRRRLPYPMPSRTGVGIKADFRLIPPSDEEAAAPLLISKGSNR